jgi:hypothetical protein
LRGFFAGEMMVHLGVENSFRAAFFRSSSSPLGSKTVFGLAPASSWSRTASGMRGSFGRGIPIMPNPRTKFLTVRVFLDTTSLYFEDAGGPSLSP